MHEDGGIDWPKVHRRLAVAEAAVRNGWRPDGKETGRILQERARVLAREAEAEDTDAYVEAVVFHLAHETYAFEIDHVREVYPLERLTPLPCTPSFVLGIAHVRGEIVSVVDIRTFFDLPERGLTDLNKLIVLESDVMCFGILVDSIAGLQRFPLNGLQASLPTLNDIREKYLKGITQERTILLDAQKLLSDERMVVQEQPG